MKQVVRLSSLCSGTMTAGAFFFLLCATAFSQELATLRVTVQDPSGGVLPGSTVTLENPETGLTRTVITGDTGLAVLTSLPAGNYRVTAEALLFEKKVLVVPLSVGQVASVTISLGIEMQQQIEVLASTETLDPEKSELSQVLDQRKVDNLPIQGRDFIDFVLLTPGVVVGQSTSASNVSPFQETVLKLSFNGVRETHTTFIALDGVDYTMALSGVQRTSPSQDWVQEFRVVHQPYTADTGRSFGNVVNTVTRSGSNEFHGTAYEFFRNDDLNAQNLLTDPDFDEFRFNQFGIAGGGPIVRDRTFFFAGYEGQRRAEAPFFSDFVSGNINGINFVKQTLGLSPENLRSVLQVQDYDKFLTRIDHQFSDTALFNARYLFADIDNDDVLGTQPGQGLPSTFRHSPQRDQTISATLINVLSPTLNLETSGQYGRRTVRLEPEGLGLEPVLQVPNLFTTGGIVGSVPFFREQRFSIEENVNYTRGNHSLRFGGEFHVVTEDVRARQVTPGFAIFSPDSFFGQPPFNQPTALVFLFGQPRSFFGKQIPPRDPNFQAGLFAGPSQQEFEEAARSQYSFPLYGLYLQDQWNIFPNFNLTLGVRYDVQIRPDDEDLASGRFKDDDFNNIQPRIGFSYSFLENRAVLRGGFGIFNGQFPFSDLVQSGNGTAPIGNFINQPLLPGFQNPEEEISGLGKFGPVGVVGPPLAGPALAQFIAAGIFPPPELLVQFPLGFDEIDIPDPYAEKASLQFEYRLGQNFLLGLEYQYLHALKLVAPSQINATPVGTLPNGKTAFQPVDPRFGFTLFDSPTGSSIYHAGIVSLRKGFSRHYSILANYTYSRSIDNVTTLQLTGVRQNFLRPDLERGLSDNHNTHRLTVAFLTESPDDWPLLLRNFKFSILSTAQSARFFTVFTGFDANGDGFPFSDRVGASGRNTFQGDDFFNFDLRLQRVIPLSDRIQAQLSIEFFNLFNQVNVLDVDTVFGAPDFFGPIPREFGDGIGGALPSFGSPRSVAPARQIQLAFRLNF